MKKRSILLTCIVAVMALAMFVGCDNAPVLPSFVVGGTINQTGDFLEGQTFDPSKFTVTITYDNGRIVAADETVSVYLDKDTGETGKVNAGDTVKADLGKNYADSDICATAAVRVYSIKSIAVEGPESYAVASSSFEVPASDLTVTATYLDSNNAEKTMVLVPGEYTVDPVALPTLSEDNPTVEASAKVTAKVGVLSSATISTQFDFTATWDGESTKLPDGAVVSRIEVAFADSVTEYSLAKLDYGTELPAVDASKLSVTAYVGEDDYTVDSSDVTFTWVDKDGFAFSSNNLLSDNESGVGILAEFAGVSYLFTNDNLTLGNVTVTVEKAGTYKDPDLVAGADLPDLASMLKAYYQVGSGTKVRIAPEDDTLTWVFASKENEYSSVSGSTPITDGKLPATGAYVIVYPVYKGQAAAQGIALGQTTDLVVTAESIAVTLADSYIAPARQYYNTLPTITKADIDSITVTYSDGSETTYTSAQVASYIDPVYYLNDKPVADLKAGVYGYDLNVDSIDIRIGFQGVTVDVPVTLSEPTVQYVALSGTPENPTIGSEINWLVQTTNDFGNIDTDYQGEMEVWVDGRRVSDLPATVGETAINNVRVIVDGVECGSAVTIAAGTAYLNVDSIQVTLAEGKKQIIDDAISTTVGDYAVVAGSWNSVGTTVETPKITKIELPATGAKVVATGNTVTAIVSFTGVSGTTETKNVTVTFNGTSVTDNMENLRLTYPEHDEVSSKQLYFGESYAFGSFAIDMDTVSMVGDDTNLKIVGYVEGTDGLKDDGTPVDGYLTSGTLYTNWSNTTFTIIVSYTARTTGELAYAEYTFSPVKAN